MRSDTRSASLDVLRIFAAAAVVALHVSSDVVDNPTLFGSATWWVANIISGATRWCVPVFVMLSGALLLSRPPTSPKAFYATRFPRLLLTLLFWSAVYIVWRIVWFGDLTPQGAIGFVIKGNLYYHLWYLYMLVGLYLLTPPLQAFVHSADRKVILLTIIIGFALACSEVFGEILWHGRVALNTTKCFAFAPYYLLGFYLFTGDWVGVFTAKKLYLTFGVVAGGAIVLNAFLQRFLGNLTTAVVYDYHNPLVIAMSVAVFLMFLPAFSIFPLFGALGPLSGVLSQVTLGVYLVHPLLLDLVKSTSLESFRMSSVFGVPLVIVIILFGAFAFSFAVSRIKFLCRIV
jgi:surface polysaccharide O-acyltransferase-like enzyme